MHARMPKNFVLEERMERYADAIETGAAAYRGRWAEACWPLERADGEGCSSRFEAVHLDLGCGKGSYIAEMARRNPRTLYLGMDSEPVCVVYAAQLICELGLPNALVIPGDAARLDSIFAPGELAAISINFPTPHPKRRGARLRVTNAHHLAGYQPLLAPGAAVTLRTDSAPLYEYSLQQFAAAGWQELWRTRDDRADHPDTPLTEYEERLSAQGATVHAVRAVPAPMPTTPEQLAAADELPQSLFDYLPEDLFEGTYIPHGMSYAIENFRNHRMHERMRAR